MTAEGRSLDRAAASQAHRPATDEARFRALAQATAQVIWIADPSGELIDPASRWATLTGLAADDYPFGGWLARVHPDDREAGDRVWWAGLASQRPFEFEQRVIAADGSVRWYLVRAVPVFDDQGELCEWVGADVDITAQRAASALIENRAGRAEFLAGLRADLDRTERTSELFELAARVIGDFFAVDRVAFWEIEGDHQTALLQAGYAKAEPPARSAPVTQLFGAETRRQLAAGHTVAIADVRLDPRTAPRLDHLAGHEARACVAVPYIHQGVWTRVLTIGSALPREWPEPDIELLRLAGERVWLAAESRRLIERLRENETRFRELAEAMPQVVWFARPDGTVEYYNQRGIELAGVQREHEGAWAWAPVVSEADQARTIEAWNHAVRSGEPYEIEHRIRQRGGAERWMLSRAVPVTNAAGEIVRWYGTATDIHDLKTAQIELERRRREFESLVENAPDVVARFDLDQRYVYVNPAIERATGIPATSFIGRTNRQLGMPADLVERWESAGSAVQASGREAYVEFSFAGPRGPRHFRTRVVPEFGADGAMTSILSVTYDITDRMEAERDRERLLEVLVHDLKNPLASLRLQVQLLQRQVTRRGVPDAPALLDRLSTIEQLGARTNDVVDEITRRAVSAEDRTAGGPRDAANLGMLVRDAVDELSPSHPLHHFQLSIHEHPITGEWDVPRLRRMLANLLGNAVKYSPRGGDIDVAVTAHAGLAIIRIEDRGIGIPEPDLPHVFEYRRRASNVQSIAGLGLGLAGSRDIARDHGGDIRIESDVGRGTTVTITLPQTGAW